MCDCHKRNKFASVGRYRQRASGGGGRGGGKPKGRYDGKKNPCKGSEKPPIYIETCSGRRVNAHCLSWSVKDRCCNRFNPTPVSFPLVDTFEHLLEALAPQVDESKFEEPFADGDRMPIVVTGDGNEVNWLAIDPIDGSDVVVWLESSENDDSKHVRVRLPPGVNESLVRAILSSPDAGTVKSVDFTVQTPFEYQSYNGVDNNLANPLWGAAETSLLRIGAADYADGKSTLDFTANPRAVSNAACRWTGAEEQPPISARNLSDLFWAFGQFIDHEVDLTLDDSGEKVTIVAPQDDPTLPGGTITLSRSRYVVDESGVRQQQNSISSYIDGTNIYGSNEKRALALRLLDGSGKLKTSNGGKYPPYNVGAVWNNANANPQVAPQDQFLCGDVRANENPLLTSFHTIGVLEHNRLCDSLLDDHPEWKGDGERIYQEARRYNIAFWQHITYDEFLPLMLGSNALLAYNGYNENVCAGIATEFSTAIYRLGHTMVSDSLHIANGSQPLIEEKLADAFFVPSFLTKYGAAAILQGASEHKMQEIDTFVVEALRNMLFGKPNDPAGHLHDLATLNLARGLDHGLPKYNAAREAYGLTKKQSFADVSSNVDVQQALASVYASVDDIDLWIGALAEDHLGGNAQVGELIAVGFQQQFTSLRDGDRFWYENILSEQQIQEVQHTTLADIIRRNTSAQVADQCFLVSQ